MFESVCGVLGVAKTRRFSGLRSPNALWNMGVCVYKGKGLVRNAFLAFCEVAVDVAIRCGTCLCERNVNHNWNKISRYPWSIINPGRRYLLIGFRCDACPSLRHVHCFYRSLQIEYPSEELANIVKTTLGVDPEVLLQSYSCLLTFYAIMWRAECWWWNTRQVVNALFDKSGKERGYVLVFTQGIEHLENTWALWVEEACGLGPKNREPIIERIIFQVT